MNKQLIYKELQLQRTNLLLAAGGLCFWILLYVLTSAARIVLIPNLMTLGELVQALHYFVLVPIAWGILPIMIGATTLAHERTLEVLDWSLAFPVSRPRQWFIKAGVASLLSFCLASLLPWLLESLLMRKLAAMHEGWIFSDDRADPRPFTLRGLWPGFYPLVLTAAGAYSSTFARDPFRVLLWSPLLLALTFFGQSLTDPQLMLLPVALAYPARYFRPWVHYVQLAALSIFLFALARHNLRFERPRLRVLSRQMLIWVILVAGSAWATLYAEFWIPSLEPWSGLSKQRRRDDRLQSLKPFPLISPNQDSIGPIRRVPESDRISLTIAGPREAYRHGEGDYDYRFLQDQNLEIEVRTGLQKQRPYYSPSAFGSNVRLLDPFPVAFNMRLLPGRNRRTYANPGRDAERAVAARQHLVQSIAGGRTFTLDRVRGDLYLMNVHNENATSDEYLLLLADGSPVEILDVEKNVADFGARLCFSPDGKWYATHLASLKHVKIRSLDSPTTWTLQAGQGDLRLASDAWPGSYFRGSDETRLGTRPAILHVSPNGRYLAFIRVFSSGEESCIAKEVDLALLDLETGAERVLHRQLISGPVDPRYFRDYYCPRLAWSDHGRLAHLSGAELFVYELSQGAAPEYWLMDKQWVPHARDLAFWSNEELLIWGDDSLDYLRLAYRIGLLAPGI